MERILFINACVRPQSRTMELARYLLGFLSGQVEEVNLEQENILPLNGARLEERQALLEQGQFDHPMLRHGRQFRQADTIVIAAPFYDYSFPSALKVYFETVANVGLTFYYDQQEQPQTLCRARRFFYISTAGSEFVPDYGYEYVKTMLAGFYHIREGHCFYADGLDLRDADPVHQLAQAREEIRCFFQGQDGVKSEENGGNRM